VGGPTVEPWGCDVSLGCHVWGIEVVSTYHVANLSGSAGEDEGDLLAAAAELVGGRSGASEAELPALDGGGHGGSGAGEESSDGGGELHGCGW
jgi:hypothetical protein